MGRFRHAVCSVIQNRTWVMVFVCFSADADPCLCSCADHPRYTKLRDLNSGGFGFVQLCRDAAYGRQVPALELAAFESAADAGSSPV